MAAVANKWRVLFNFFTKAEAPTGYATFMDSWWETATFVQNTKHFGVTQLHRNLDSEALYKFVNYAGFDSDDFDGFKPPAGEWLKMMQKTSGGNAIEAHPGGYREIGTADGQQWAPALAKSDNSVFLISNYKVEDESDPRRKDFEDDWMKASGAQFIIENVPKSLGLGSIGIYRRFTMRKNFAYVLRAELTGVGSDLTEAWDFVGKVRAQSSPDVISEVNTSLYKIMPETILFHADNKFPKPN
ncbi:uncharacterized protein LOC117114239 [Anneissia japonica]|uniref:uncharacterized protein LOC117114239 n=1 Tax=Anneissia japonica TaxID=1529436 RepID=UPI00142553C7|nr:uncharacterized protein LOC117114239 [Anneissia japonica]